MISRKRSSLALTAILTFALHLVNIGPLHTTAAATPVVITNEAQLLAIQSNLSEAYTVGASFNVSETTSATYITGTFTGSLNGNGFTISGLSAPLFDNIGGSVSNLNLITAPGGIGDSLDRINTGVLAAKLLSDMSVANVHVAGLIIANLGNRAGYQNLGGLIGENQSGSKISNSSSSVNIDSDSGSDSVGGLVGYLGGGSITGSISTGAITTNNVAYCTGGLVGYIDGNSRIETSTSSSNVTVILLPGTSDVGGLVGCAYGTTLIKNSSASGSVVNSGGAGAGGLIGEAGEDVTISNVYASGNVSASTSDQVGGLIGYLKDNAAVSNSYATGNVLGDDKVGGLIGESVGSTTNSRARGSATGTFNVGALIGSGPAQDSTPLSETTDLDLLNTGQTAAWGQSQIINSGKPYILALIDRGFYLVTTPQAAAPAAVSEAEAKAAAAVAAAKREAEVKTARADISKALQKADNLTADSFAKADIAGVTKENIAEVQAEILALPAELRTDINQVLKVARKFEVVGKIASEQATALPISAFVEVGLIPAESKNKVALIAAIRRASADSRDSFADIKAVIAAEAARIQDRKDRLAAAMNRIKTK